MNLSRHVLLRRLRHLHSVPPSRPIFSSTPTPTLTFIQPPTYFTSHNFSSLSGGFTYPAPRSLDAIAKTQLLSKHTSSRVTEIWHEHHAQSKTAISDVLHVDRYTLLRQRTQRCPLFVVPIGRDKGYFSLIVQWQGRQALCTFLDDYKQNSQNAMPYLTLTFFDDFVETKAIALMRADVTQHMSKTEAKM